MGIERDKAVRPPAGILMLKSGGLVIIYMGKRTNGFKPVYITLPSDEKIDNG